MAFGYDYYMPMYACPGCSYVMNGLYLRENPDMETNLKGTENMDTDGKDMYKFPPNKPSPGYRVPLLPLLLTPLLLAPFFAPPPPPPIYYGPPPFFAPGPFFPPGPY